MAQTLEELQNQLQTYQERMPLTPDDQKQDLLKGIEATQKQINDLQAQQPESVLDPTPSLQQQQAGTPLPPPDPQTQPRQFKEQIPQLTPEGNIALDLVPKMPVPSATQQAQAPIEQPAQDGIKEVSLADVQSQQQQLAGLAPQYLTTTQTTIKPGVKLPEELKKSIGEIPSALAEMGKVQNKLSEIENQRSGLLQEYQEAIMGFQNEEILRKQQHQNMVNEKLAKYDEEALKLADEKIDSKRWWKNQETGQRIGTTLAVVLGALGQGLSGSQTNAAVDAINKEIDRDVQDQIRNLNNRKEANKEYMKRIRNVVSDFDNDQSRRYAAMNMMLTPVVKKLEGLQQDSQSAIQQSNIEAVKQGLINTQNQLRIKAAEMQQPQISKTILSKPTGGAKTAKEIREQTRFEQEQRNLTVPGFKGKAFNAKKADMVRDALDRYNIMEDTIKKLKGLSKTKLKDRVVADSIVKGLIGNLRVDLTGPGALSEGDMKLLNRLLPNPTDLFQINNMARLETIAENLKRNVVQFAKGQGLKATSGAFATESAGRKYAK